MDHVFLMSVLTGISVLGVLSFVIKDCFSKISMFPKLILIEPITVFKPQPITVLNPLGKLKAV
jgi:hypothetical protein